MRVLGLTCLIVGFLWVAWDCATGFVVYQYARCMRQTQHLPAGETIKRADAAGAMWELSLDLKNRHRQILIPALLMLAGGLTLAFNKRARHEKPVAESAAAGHGGKAARPTGSTAGEGAS